MTRYMARWTWTDADPGGSTLSGDGLRGIAVHWPGTQTPRYGTEPAGTVMGRIRSWRDYHVDGNGWSDIGYNFAIDQAGRVWELRGIDRVGAHCASGTNPDANHEWLGVLVVLGAAEAPSGAMVDAFRDFRTTRFLTRWPDRSQVVGHGQVYGAFTECPGHHAMNLIQAGALTRPPRQEDDDMTPDQLLDALDSDRGRKILASAVLDPGDIKDAAERDTTAGRWLATHTRDMLLKAGIDGATADEVIQHELPRSMVEGETLGLAIARMRRQLDQIADAVGAAGGAAD